MRHSLPMGRWGPAGLWVLFTAVAVTSGLLAVALVGQAVTSSSGPVLSAAEVTAQLNGAHASGAPTASSTPGGHHSSGHSTKSGKPSQPTSRATGTSTATTSPSGKPTATTSTQPPKPSHTRSGPSSTVRTISSRGGTVVAECTANRVYLRTWSPFNGYRVADVRRGPAAEAEIQFVNAASEVNLHVRCSGGVPVGSQEVSGDGATSDQSLGDE